MSMFTFDAARRILREENIGPVISTLFSDKEERETLIARATEFAQSRDNVLDHVWSHLGPLTEKAFERYDVSA